MDTVTGIITPGGQGIGRRAIKRLAAVARAGVFGLVVGVLLFAAMLGTAGQGAAAPLTTSSSGWTPQNFDSSCKGAGGKSREIKQTNPESGQVNVHYSYCDFGSGGRNTCDWIKKTCTFGIIAQPQPQRLRVTVGDVRLSSVGSNGVGGQDTGGGNVGANGSGTALAADDDER